MDLDTRTKRPATESQPAQAPAAPVSDSETFRPAEWWLTASAATDYHRAFYTTLLVLAGLFALVCAHGPCLQLAWSHDDIVFLDNAWKVRQGVLPHADFPSGLGALPSWIFAVGLILLGPTAAVLPVCDAAVAFGVGLLGWSVARRRLPAWPASFFALTQALLAVTPHLLRDTWLAATYAGNYNRQGYALLSILLLAMFLPETGDDRARDDRRTGRVAGALLGVLFFLKISYCLAGVGLCAVAMPCARRGTWTLGKNLAAASAVVFLLGLPLLRFDLPALLRDLHMASAARAGGAPGAVFTLGRFLSEWPAMWVESTLLAAMQLTLRPPWLRRRVGGGASTPAWTELVAVTGAAMFIYLTNAPAKFLAETPLLASWLFVLVAAALRRPMVDTPRWRLPVLGGAAGALWTFTFGPGLVCLVWSISPVATDLRRAGLAGAPVFESAALADLRIYGNGGEEALPEKMTYAEKVNDGLRLLRKLGGPHRVAAVDYANPFPFALGWPALRGNLWCWHLHFSFSEAACPTPEQAFGDADVLMIPKYPGEAAGYAAMFRLYGPYIKAHFKPSDRSNQWIVLHRG